MVRRQEAVGDDEKIEGELDFQPPLVAELGHP